MYVHVSYLLCMCYGEQRDKVNVRLTRFALAPLPTWLRSTAMPYQDSSTYMALALTSASSSTILAIDHRLAPQGSQACKDTSWTYLLGCLLQEPYYRQCTVVNNIHTIGDL